VTAFSLYLDRRREQLWFANSDNTERSRRLSERDMGTRLKRKGLDESWKKRNKCMEISEKEIESGTPISRRNLISGLLKERGNREVISQETPDR